jgi:hypothetical protein
MRKNSRKQAQRAQNREVVGVGRGFAPFCGDSCFLFSTLNAHLDTVASGEETMSDRNTISILISQESCEPPKQVTGIPWYPGITVLQAMVIAQSMHPGSFSFRVLYHSFYGAFVDMIDSVADADPKYWTVSVSNNPLPVGASEAIVLEDRQGENVEIEWKFGVPEADDAPQASRKTKALAE